MTNQRIPDHTTPTELTLPLMRQHFTSAIVCDALDQVGYLHQSPRVAFPLMTVPQVLIGRAKTTLWSDLFHADPKPYELELRAVDECQPDDVLIAAAGGSVRSGIWGELLSTAAANRGCVGVIVDGAVRDVARMQSMAFPVFARGSMLYDSKDRQRVTDLDVPVEIGGVTISPGDLVVADRDGIVVVPRKVETVVLQRAWAKVHAENLVRDAIRAGMLATAAYEKFGVL